MKTKSKAGWLMRAGAVWLTTTASLFAVQSKPSVAEQKDGSLAYVAEASGDRVPDFSHAGYGGGGVPLPVAVPRVVVAPVDGDDGARLQAAIDYVSQLPLGADGVRGAVVLTRGRYDIAGALTISASGVVVRGAGAGEDGTVLVATGTDRRTLLTITGRDDRVIAKQKFAVLDAYVPVGATTLRVKNSSSLTVGARVVVERPSTKAWIERLGMHVSPGPTPFTWKPGNYDILWDRTVTAIAGEQVTLDAPLTTALESELGGGLVATYTWAGRLTHVGVESLRCESVVSATNPLDEEHAWNAIDIDQAENSWVRDVTMVHFAGSAVQLGRGTRAITVSDCHSRAPVSELAGYRRHTFYNAGQLALFVRCTTEEGRHDFVVGYVSAGPNVFLQCDAVNARGFSGSIGSWASGVLFDNVNIDRGSLRLDNLEFWNQGVGWNAANCVLWQSTAAIAIVRNPPGARNWANGTWAQFIGNGVWSECNEFVNPQSLYRGQLAARKGAAALAALEPVAATPVVTGVPALEQAVPDLAAKLAPRPRPAGAPLALSNGWLIANGALLTGSADPISITWWRGQMNPARTGEFGVSLTRWAPGLAGVGVTDDLAEVTDTMLRKGSRVLRHHYGLWYDRRRDDHERIRRPDADVWPPFYEQPWARSGQGEQWNGLSRYDLTKFNPWYFGRLRTFADLARDKGLVLVNEMYFQHNIIEAGAHWADSPWRPANALQATGFPEPPVYAEGKRIFMADAFYDVTHPVRRELHRAYIRQCLQNLADQPNVIHTTSEEYTGPLHFMEFWLDVVAEWEQETGKHPLIALSATKDVQDAILADPKRAALISIIDLKYWWQSPKGLYAPQGGINLAPRQHERLWKGGRPTTATVAGMVAEYRQRFPDKAIIADLDNMGGWAFVAAGGSLGQLPATTDRALLNALAAMRPVSSTPESWVLGEPGRQWFVYAAGASGVSLDLTGAPGTLTVRKVDLVSGQLSPAPSLTGGGRATLESSGPAAFWICR